MEGQELGYAFVDVYDFVWSVKSWHIEYVE